jgi:hypothetical protein
LSVVDYRYYSPLLVYTSTFNQFVQPIQPKSQSSRRLRPTLSSRGKEPSVCDVQLVR